MRVCHGQHEHLLVLSDEEAQQLADACALLLCASSIAVDCRLPPGTHQVLAGVFSALTGPCPEA